MHSRLIGVVLATACLALALPAQGRGKDRPARSGTGIDVRIGTGRTTQAPPGHSRGKAWWKHGTGAPPGHSRGKAWWKNRYPVLCTELGRHPQLRIHLEANPGLFDEIRVRVDRDGDGRLSSSERDRFVGILQDQHARSGAPGGNGRPEKGTRGDGGGSRGRGGRGAKDQGRGKQDGKAKGKRGRN